MAEPGPGAPPRKPHRCDETCLCAVHGTALIYSPAFDDHACQDSSCKYAHGGAPVTDPESVAAFLARHRADPWTVTVTIPLDTPGARQSAALAAGYPDWESMAEAARQADAEPRPRLISETETAGCYQIWHHGRIAVLEAELAKPTESGDWKLYCREIAPGKYELGWERQ
jgi:hypothetical protein